MLLEVLAFALVVVSVLLTVYRPGRVRVGGVVLLSARSLWRPWLLAVAAIAVRVALLKQAPFETPGRIAPAHGGLGRNGAGRVAAMVAESGTDGGSPCGRARSPSTACSRSSRFS